MNTRDRQLDLFVALLGDVPFRDDREAMSAPLVSLSKNMRTRIEWEGPSGQRVVVSAGEDYGIATIWDYDVILWAISQINMGVEMGVSVSPRVAFHPYNLLKAVGRNTGGKGYAELKAALDRLTSTSVHFYASPKPGKKARKDGAFNLLTGYVLDKNDEGQIKGGWIEIAPWLYDAVVEGREVLAISPRYFDLTSGLDRFLYRLARRHAGKQDGGFRFSFRDLHGRSGSSQSYGDFARDLRKAIKRDALPEYRLAEVEGQGGPMLHLWRDPARCGLPQDRRLDWKAAKP